MYSLLYFNLHIPFSPFAVALSEQPDLPIKTVRSQQLLLQNSLKDKYALSEKIMNPPSFPDKYVRLVGLLEDAVEKEEAKKTNGGLLGWFKR